MFRDKKWPETVYLLLFLGSLLMVTGGLLLLYIEFRSEGILESVKIEGLSTLSEEEVLNSLSVSEGSFIDEELMGLLESELEKNPYISGVDLKFNGGELLIRIQEQQCVFVMRTRTGLIDIGSNLNPIAQSSRCVDVPVLSGDIPEPDRLKDQPRLVRFVAHYQEAKQNYPGLVDRLSEVHFERTGGVTVYMIHKQLRALLPELPGPLSFEKLSAAVYYIEEEKIDATVIDLRGSDALILAEN